MFPTKTQSVIAYSLAILTIISCLVSICGHDIYQDGAWANAQWFGQDIVTALLALPILNISFHYGIKKGHVKWIMVYAGILLYYAIPTVFSCLSPI